MIGKGQAHGAVTVVNAIPASKGAAIGLSLATEARAELADGKGPVEVVIGDAQNEDPSLGEAVVAVVGEHLDRPLHGTLTTTSEIPIATGLKSSSTAANAMLLAVLDAVGQRLDEATVLRLSVAAARRAGVTVTGALDDTAASLLGGLVLTDNARERVVKRKPLGEAHHVLLLVPPRRRYTAATGDALTDAAALTKRAWALAHDEAWEDALTLNGLAVAAALGEPLEATYQALGAGALAAGLTGTGPAVAAVCPPEARTRVLRAWADHDARILETTTTDAGALP